MILFLLLGLFWVVNATEGPIRVRPPYFGFALRETCVFPRLFAEQVIPQFLGLRESHTLVAVKITARVSAGNSTLHEDWKIEAGNRESLFLGRDDHSDVVNLGHSPDAVLLAVNGHNEQIANLQFAQVDDRPIPVFSRAELDGGVSAEGAISEAHRSVWNLNVRTTSKNGSCVRRFAGFGYALRAPMVRTFRVLDLPSCFERSGIGGFFVGEVGGYRLLGNCEGPPCRSIASEQEAIHKEWDARFPVFVHQLLTAATQHSKRHVFDHRTERARTQGPSFLVLLESAKTKTLALLKQNQYTLIREAEKRYLSGRPQLPTVRSCDTRLATIEKAA